MFFKSKTPAAPKVAAPVPVPQPDDPNLVDVKRQVALDASQREGFRSSLLTPGGARGVTRSDENSPKRRMLGPGSSTASGGY
jgi:hypothetical protein